MVQSERDAAPEIIERNMAEGRIGLRTSQGFLDYDGMDVEAYRNGRLAELATQLQRMGLSKPPVLD